MNWFYATDGKQVGPISQAEFDSLVNAGTIHAGTLVWHEGMADWQPYGTLAGGAASRTPTSGVVCTECGNAFPQDEVIKFGDVWVCAACKPTFLQRLKEGGAIAGILQYAGFWARFGAQFLDGLILYVFNMLVGVAIGFSMVRAMRPAAGSRSAVAFLGIQAVTWLIDLAVAMSYETFFVGKYGATPGKLASKLRVVTAEGGPVGYGRACGRYWAKQLSNLTLLIGYLMAAFDKEQHRALHDRICNTRVVKR